MVAASFVHLAHSEGAGVLEKKLHIASSNSLPLELIRSELSDLADCSHRLGRTTRRSVFFVEKPKSGQDLERYSDRYLYETDKPPIRTLIHGQAWNVCGFAVSNCNLAGI